MTTLEPPVKRYVLGKLPSHSSTKNLASNFVDITPEVMNTIMEHAGYMSNGKPQKKALDDGVVDVCEKTIVWNLDEVQKVLTRGGLTVTRRYVNQEIPQPTSSDPQFVTLTVLGTYFNVSAKKIGSWIDDCGLRDDDGLPTKDAQDDGLAQVAEVETRSNQGKKKVRPFGVWDLHRMLVMLTDKGHPLDMDYGSTLKGKGKNSDVSVSTSLDAKVNEFTEKFVELFNKRDRECIRLVRQTPTLIHKHAERKMNKPGFITTNTYKRFFD